MQEFHLELASQTGKHPPQTVLHIPADPAPLNHDYGHRPIKKEMVVPARILKRRKRREI